MSNSVEAMVRLRAEFIERRRKEIRQTEPKWPRHMPTSVRKCWRDAHFQGIKSSYTLDMNTGLPGVSGASFDPLLSLADLVEPKARLGRSTAVKLFHRLGTQVPKEDWSAIREFLGDDAFFVEGLALQIESALAEFELANGKTATQRRRYINEVKKKAHLLSLALASAELREFSIASLLTKQQLDELLIDFDGWMEVETTVNANGSRKHYLGQRSDSLKGVLSLRFPSLNTILDALVKNVDALDAGSGRVDFKRVKIGKHNPRGVFVLRRIAYVLRQKTSDKPLPIEAMLHVTGVACEVELDIESRFALELIKD